VLKLNAAVLEWFVAFDFRQMKYTGIRFVPVMSAAALSRMMITPPAFSSGRVSAIAYGGEGEATHYWGSHVVEDRSSGGQPSSTGYWQDWSTAG
jgi:hypothetical protein